MKVSKGFVSASAGFAYYLSRSNWTSIGLATHGSSAPYNYGVPLPTHVQSPDVTIMRVLKFEILTASTQREGENALQSRTGDCRNPSDHLDWYPRALANLRPGSNGSIRALFSFLSTVGIVPVVWMLCGGRSRR